MVINSQSLPISPTILKDSFAGYRIPSWTMAFLNEHFRYASLQPSGSQCIRLLSKAKQQTFAFSKMCRLKVPDSKWGHSFWLVETPPELLYYHIALPGVLRADFCCLLFLSGQRSSWIQVLLLSFQFIFIICKLVQSVNIVTLRVRSTTYECGGNMVQSKTRCFWWGISYCAHDFSAWDMFISLSVFKIFLYDCLQQFEYTFKFD